MNKLIIHERDMIENLTISYYVQAKLLQLYYNYMKNPVNQFI